MFDNLLTILAKIGLSLLAVFFALKWFIVVPYLWFKYDRPILKLKKGLNEFKNEQRGKPITQLSIDGNIRQKTMIVNEKLEVIETQRKLFIDRINLILSISSISKS
jgi:hypothetical protein